jgi:biotin carboxyl carrier protein
MIVLAKCIARCFLVGGAAALAGCAAYERLPLDKESSLAASASELEGAGAKRFTLAALDRLVVLNNPDLRAARAKLGVGAAQVLQAGILPNPPVAVSYPFVIAGPGITQNVKSILLLWTKGEAAQNAASEISATLLWKEWQTIGKARLLFIDTIEGERAEKLMFQSRKFLQERFNLTSTAIGQGNATLATLSPDLVALGDIQKTSDDLERLQLSRRHQLNALLGLAPGVAAEEGSVLVTTMAPRRGSLHHHLRDGRSALNGSMTISLQSQGRVLQFDVTPGEAVKAGQPLLEFGVSESALGSDRQAETALQTAEVERARIAQLLRQQLATKDQLTQADKAIADAETTLDTLKKSGSGQPNLSIKAPFDGVVSAIPVAQGDTIAPGAPMITLMRIDGLVVSVGIEPS